MKVLCYTYMQYVYLNMAVWPYEGSAAVWEYSCLDASNRCSPVKVHYARFNSIFKDGNNSTQRSGPGQCPGLNLNVSRWSTACILGDSLLYNLSQKSTNHEQNSEQPVWPV